MAYSLLVTCEQCGYENFPQHRFCGMCGAALRVPEPVGVRIPTGQKPTGTAQKPVTVATQSAGNPESSPTFRGLAHQPNVNDETASYLLEDDEEPQHRGRYLVMILFIAAVAVAGWHWREYLAGLVNKSVNEQASAAATATPPLTAPAPPTSELAPAASTNTAAQIPAPATQPQAPSVPTSAASSPASSPPVAAPPSSPQPEAAAGTAPTSVTSPPSQPAQSEQGGSSQAAEPAASGQPEAAAPTTQPARELPAKTAKAKAATPGVAGDASELEGEKYLYGNGVPQNCARAQKSLLAAAQRSNARAQSVLGTMYATGHCVGRDLPLAYRWFAKSLHQDPSNTRLEDDLQALWNRMTPEERQLAMRSGQ